jgi:hypothetical protein
LPPIPDGGPLTLGVIEFPVLVVYVANIHEIAPAVAESASALTGRPEPDFDVTVQF